MEHRALRSTISILRTVLHLLADDPTLRADSETVLEFKHATLKLIAEIQAEHGITEQSRRPSLDEVSQDTARKP
jgi:hypothetical protein